MTNIDHNVAKRRKDKAQKRFSRVSWCIIAFSLLTDTSHVRSFPSYNIMLGVWACYCGHCKIDGKCCDSKTKKRQQCDNGMYSIQIQKMVTAFGITTLASILFDAIFCFLWGKEVSYSLMHLVISVSLLDLGVLIYCLKGANCISKKINYLRLETPFKYRAALATVVPIKLLNSIAACLYLT